jgi:hypothetical protein
MALFSRVGSGGIAPSILNIFTRWNVVVYDTDLRHYHRRRSPLYQFDAKLRGPHSRYRHCEKRKASNPITLQSHYDIF